MRPNDPTFLVISVLLLAPGAAGAQAPAASSAAAAAATQALEPRAMPEPALVPLGATPAAPAPTAGRDEEVVTGPADAPDDPEVAGEIEEQSAELEAIHRAEQQTKVQDAPRAEDRAAESAAGLGLESPLRDRVGDALGREIAPPHAAGQGRIPLLPELDHDLAQLQAEYDIPIEVNEAVAAYVRFFQSPLVRPHFVKWLGRSHRYLEKYRAILKEEGLPEDTVYLAMIESGFGNFAYSRARASGPWQFIGETGRLYGLKQDFWVDERRDPEKSARAAARFLKKLHEQTGDWRLAWAGYNAGAGRVLKAQAMGYADFWSMAATRGRKVLRDETKGYVPKLMAAAIISKHPEAFGFKPEEIEPQQWQEYDEVEIGNATLLSVVARAAGVSERDIIDLNPELRRACTPPRAYELKIPKAKAETFAQNWPAMKDQVRLTFAGHVVRRRETLARIAAQHGVPVRAIVEMNGLRPGRRLRPGQELLIPRPVGAGASAVALARAPEPSRRAETARRAETRRVPTTEVSVASARAAQDGAAKTKVKVRAGDTLWSISQKYGVELTDLCRWNNIKDPRRHKLLAGTRLVVYAERG